MIEPLSYTPLAFVERLAEERCQVSTSTSTAKPCMDEDIRKPFAKYGADRACMTCVARALLDKELKIKVDEITANDYLSVVENTGWLAGSFNTALIRAFQAADSKNTTLLTSVYPLIGEAHRMYTKVKNGREKLRKIANHEEGGE